MSLTIRMRRALAAFRSNPDESFLHPGRGQYVVTIPRSVAKEGEEAIVKHLTERMDELREDSPDWIVITAWHKYRIIGGKRLDFFVNGKGIQKIQYEGRMYYGVDCRRLLAKLGLK